MWVYDARAGRWKPEGLLAEFIAWFADPSREGTVAAWAEAHGVTVPTVSGWRRDPRFKAALEREYIASLAQAYEAYFNAYTASPVLKIETDALDIVQRPQDVQRIAELIRAKLAEGPVQGRLL